MDAARILRVTRKRAGLTQRELATKTGIAQPTIARIERGQEVPRVDTLQKLLIHCGWRLEPKPRRGKGVDRTLAWEALRKTPAERLKMIEEYGRFFGDLRERRRAAKLGTGT